MVLSEMVLSEEKQKPFAAERECMITGLATTVKRRLHFYSDCWYFAGCEHMLLVLLADEDLLSQYQISFTYRYSSEYKAGLNSRAPATSAKIFPICLPDLDAQLKPICWRPARIVARALGYGLMLRYWFIIWDTLVLYRSWRNLQIDLLHINNGGYPGAASCTSAVFAARLLHVQTIVYVVNNIAEPYQSFLRWPDYLFDRLVARWVTLFVTGSACAAQTLRRVLSVSAGKVTNIPNGVTRVNATEDPQAVRERLAAHSRFIVAVAAVLEERKGHVYLFRALDLMRQRGVHPLPLVIVIGAGSQDDFLRDFVHRAGLQDAVHFVGQKQRADYLNLLNAADAVVLPSVSHEDFPNVVIEAFSLGKPVIGTSVAGIPEQIEPEVTGLLVPPRDPVALADALKRLVNDSALRQSLGQAAQSKFQREYRDAVSAKRYRCLYNELLCKTPLSPSVT